VREGLVDKEGVQPTERITGEWSLAISQIFSIFLFSELEVFVTKKSSISGFLFEWVGQYIGPVGETEE
jgi:hypothetical protein